MDFRSVARDYTRLAGFTLVAAAAITMGYRIYEGLCGAPATFAPHLREKYVEHLGLVLTHGCSGCAALVLGISQFNSSFRRRYTSLHRAVGSVYLLCVLVAGITALPMAAMAYGGAVAQLGFTMLAVSWLISGALVIRGLMKREMISHGEWMTRNYALTFSAVLVRVYLTIGDRLELSTDVTYVLVAWLSWAPTLAVVEVLFVRTHRAEKAGLHAQA